MSTRHERARTHTPELTCPHSETFFSPDLSGLHCPAPPVFALACMSSVYHVLFSSCWSLPLLTISSYFMEDDVEINPTWGSENKGELDSLGITVTDMPPGLRLQPSDQSLSWSLAPWGPSTKAVPFWVATVAGIGDELAPRAQCWEDEEGKPESARPHKSIWLCKCVP